MRWMLKNSGLLLKTIYLNISFRSLRKGSHISYECSLCRQSNILAIQFYAVDCVFNNKSNKKN